MDLSPVLGPALAGFVIGCVLFGVSVLQTYQYFSKYRNDRGYEKLAIAFMCSLDVLHLVCSVHMVYFYLLKHYGDPAALTEAIWSVKVLGIAQVIAVWLVQGLYFHKILTLASGLIIHPAVKKIILVGTTFFVLLAIAIGIVFIINLAELKETIIPANRSWVIYAGFSVSALIDIAIAMAMVYLLRMGHSGMKKTNNVVSSLVRHFISSGLFTSIAAVVYIVLYAVSPTGLLYLGMEFVITRLYVNSFLALCNSRKHLNKQIHHFSTDQISTSFRMQLNNAASGSSHSHSHSHSGGHGLGGPYTHLASPTTPSVGRARRGLGRMRNMSDTMILPEDETLGEIGTMTMEEIGKEGVSMEYKPRKSSVSGTLDGNERDLEAGVVAEGMAEDEDKEPLSLIEEDGDGDVERGERRVSEKDGPGYPAPAPVPPQPQPQPPQLKVNTQNQNHDNPVPVPAPPPLRRKLVTILHSNAEQRSSLASQTPDANPRPVSQVSVISSETGRTGTETPGLYHDAQSDFEGV